MSGTPARRVGSKQLGATHARRGSSCGLIASVPKMSSGHSRRIRQERKNVKRRRQAQQGAARKTQRDQVIARAQQVPEATRRRKHFTAYVLWAVAATLGIAIFLIYTNVVQTMSTDAANVLLGFPAIILAITGAIAYGE